MALWRVRFEQPEVSVEALTEQMDTNPLVQMAESIVKTNVKFLEQYQLTKLTEQVHTASRPGVSFADVHAEFAPVLAPTRVNNRFFHRCFDEKFPPIVRALDASRS